MPAKACPRCGAIVRDQGETYCPQHKRDPQAHWSKGRDRGAQKRFRAAVVELFGGQCGAMDGSTRCPVTLADESMQAHHKQPGNDDPRTGVLLCRLHHKQVDSHAR